jgi:hypothetical protein
MYVTATVVLEHRREPDGAGAELRERVEVRLHAGTCIVVPDTQYLLDDDRGDSEPVKDAFDRVVGNRASDNSAFVSSLGDVTQDGLQNEVDRASDAYRILAGNHDIDSSKDDARGPSVFLNAFDPATR